MTPSYFIAALPKFSSPFYKKMESLYALKCYPEFRLPFHVTLFYFGLLNPDQISSLSHWLEDKRGRPKFKTKVKGVNHFDNNGRLVYFLELESPELEKLNEGLEHFGVRVDTFPYKPHLSLFFPLFELNRDDENLLAKTFKNVREIELGAIYLASSINHVTRIHKRVPFS